MTTPLVPHEVSFDHRWKRKGLIEKSIIQDPTRLGRRWSPRIVLPMKTLRRRMDIVLIDSHDVDFSVPSDIFYLVIDARSFTIQVRGKVYSITTIMSSLAHFIFDGLPGEDATQSLHPRPW